AIKAMRPFRRFGGRTCPGGLAPMAGNGAVGGSDANHGPEDLLPPESLVTHATVPTGQFWHKRSCFIGAAGRPAGRLPRPPGLTRGARHKGAAASGGACLVGLGVQDTASDFPSPFGIF